MTAGTLPPGVELVFDVDWLTALLAIPKTPGTYTFTITGAKSGSTQPGVIRPEPPSSPFPAVSGRVLTYVLIAMLVLLS